MGSKGDLVYIPSSVTIYQSSGGDEPPWSAYRVTDKPMNVLCVGGRDGWKKIIYDSEVWLVKEHNVYTAKKEYR